MKKALSLLAVLVLLAAMQAGCGKVSGTYYSHNEEDVTIEFNSDGTFQSLHKGEKVIGGTFKKKGKTVTMNTDDGKSITGTLDGNMLIIEKEDTGTNFYTKK